MAPEQRFATHRDEDDGRAAGVDAHGPQHRARSSRSRWSRRASITTPPRDFGPNAPPNVYFTDPDVITVDPAFNGLRQANAPIQRLWTGALWSEGPAWSGQGRYLVWSDIPNNRQLRWIEDDGRVTRVPHAVEQQQRQHVRLPGPPALVRAPDAARGALRARRLGHAHRRHVQRQAAELAQRRRAASRRQLLVHRSAVRRPALRGRAGRGGRAEQPRRPAQAAAGPAARAWASTSASCRTASIASIRAAGSTSSITEQQVSNPNGLCFSPDYKKLYVASTGRGPGDTGPGGNRDIHVFDVGADNKASNGKVFTDCMVDGVKCGPDGVRTRRRGQRVVRRATPAAAVGYSGVTVWNPDGKLIGRIRLPEVCGNICFGGPKRNRLFMAASQSLYAVYVSTQGAAPGVSARRPAFPATRPRPDRAGPAGRRAARALPLHRQRRRHPRQGARTSTASRGRLTDGIGLTVAMQAMNMLDQLQPVEGIGPGRRDPPGARSRDLHGAALRAARGGDDRRHAARSTGTPWGACPRAFLKRQIAACAAAGFSVRAAFECEFSLATREPDGSFAPLDESLCFSTRRDDDARPA